MDRKSRKSISRRHFLESSTVAAVAGLAVVACSSLETQPAPVATATQVPTSAPTVTPMPTTAPAELKGSSIYENFTIYKNLYPSLPRGGRSVLGYGTRNPTTLNPMLSPSFATFHSSDAINDWLEHLDENGNIVGSLAESLEIIDGRSLKYTLHKGITFHNGRKVTAEDVKNTIEYVQDEKNGLPIRSSVTGIKPELIDENTILLKLDKPDASIRASLLRVPIIPVEEASKLGNAPIGCGPYIFVEWKLDQYIELAKNPNYWNPEAPRLDSLRFRFFPDAASSTQALIAGEVEYDHQPNLADKARLESTPGVATVIIDPGFLWLIPNHEVEPYDNLKVRQAISMALDRPKLADLAFFGLGTPYWFPGLPKGSPYYPKDLEKPRDVEGAKRLMAEAGLQNGFSDKLHTLNVDYFQAQAVVIKDNLAEIGIDLNLSVTDEESAINRIFTQKEFGLAHFGDAVDPEPAFVLNRYLMSTGDSNATGYRNSELDDLLTKATATFDEAERKKLYRAILQKAILEDVVYIPLTSEPYVKGYRVPLNAPLFVVTANARMHWPVAAKG